MSLRSPFRSTTNLVARRRQRPVVERATFVLASLRTWRVAFPVEFVERVLRAPRSGDMHALAPEGVHYQGRVVPWAPLAFASASASGEDPCHMAGERVLIIHDQTRGDRRWALPVTAVHEVYAVETALVLPPSAAPSPAPADQPSQEPLHAAVRGLFERHGHRVFVVDPVRLLVGTT